MKARLQYKLEQALGLLAEIQTQRDELSDTEQERLATGSAALGSAARSGSGSEPFYKWLDRQKNRQDRTGDLARWSQQDKKWPRDNTAALSLYVERLRLTNLTKEALRVPGASGAEMVERYLYPAWDEYMQALKPIAIPANRSAE